MTLAGQRARTSRGASPQAPDQFATLALWLKADAITGKSDSEAISTWTDSSAAAHDATQASGSLQPLYKTNIINGLPTVKFDGTDDLLRADAVSASFTGTDVAHTVIVALKLASTSGTQCFFSVGRSSSSTYEQCLLQSGQWRAIRNDDAALALTIGATTANTNPHVYSYVFNGTTAGLFLDGRAMITPTTAQDNGALTVDRCAVGALQRSSAANFCSADIAEVVVYTRALLTAERRAVELHLGSKYGIVIT